MGCSSRVSMFQEIGNDVGPMPGRMLGLEHEAGIFLIALGREAHIVKLNLVHARLGRLLGQSDIVFLHLGLRRVGPDQLAVFPPGLTGLM